jgi:hyperosmotically inducible protein
MEKGNGTQKGRKEETMLNKIRKHLLGIAVPILLLSLAASATALNSKGTTSRTSSQQLTDLQNKIRHSLLMLPYYGVFDTISFSVEGDTVILTGEVQRALLKSEAEWAVRNTAGVTHVANNIEILPLSPMDDSIRAKAYRAIYSQPDFEKYEIQSEKPIRIIVKNGNITLFGSVLTQLDKTMAEMAARGIPFVFSVTDNLTVD